MDALFAAGVPKLTREQAEIVRILALIQVESTSPRCAQLYTFINVIEHASVEPSPYEYVETADLEDPAEVAELEAMGVVFDGDLAHRQRPYGGAIDDLCACVQVLRASLEPTA